MLAFVRGRRLPPGSLEKVASEDLGVESVGVGALLDIRAVVETTGEVQLHEGVKDRRVRQRAVAGQAHHVVRFGPSRRVVEAVEDVVEAAPIAIHAEPLTQAGHAVVAGLIAGGDGERVDPFGSSDAFDLASEHRLPKDRLQDLAGEPRRRRTRLQDAQHAHVGQRDGSRIRSSPKANGRYQSNGRVGDEAAMISANCAASVTPTTAASTSPTDIANDTAACSGVRPRAAAADRNAASGARAGPK